MDEASTPSTGGDVPAHAATILVIDDDAFTLSLVSKVLKPAPYKVITTESAKAGIELFREHRPDLVITDMMMPDIDGIEAIRILRGIDPGARIIAMSGGGRSGFTPVLRAAKALGANETIKKPFQPVDFLAAVARVLDRRG